MPSVSGHYCFVFEYTATELNGEAIANGSGRSQRNVNVAPGPFLNPYAKNSITQARHANDAIQDGQFILGALTDAQSLPSDVAITHVNLYDGTVEGLRHRTRPVFCVQYHPEAAPGPHDADYLFRQFLDEMEKRA